MTEVDISKKLFNKAYLPYLEDYSRTQIFFGGSSSGKSVFLAQRCIMDIMRGGRNYLICREVGRTLRGSVFTEIIRVMKKWGVECLFTVNKTDMLITCHNGYQIIFAGLDDAEKLKSLIPLKGVLTDIWVEEATETERTTIKQLYKRQRGGNEAIKKRLTLSFNPILQTNWIYEDYFAPINWADLQTEFRNEDLSILKTTYKDNAFLTTDDVKDLENEKDKYYYDVYTLGKWGIIGNVIFTNWRVEDLSEMQAQFVNIRNGLDFGFASNPAGYTRSHYDKMRKTIYFIDELYEVGLTNPELASLLQPILREELIICDSAEPKSIKELRNLKINAVGAKKGKDSVNFGIQWLQQQTLVIDKKCINTRNELQTYKWKEDKNGNSIPIPVDRNDHIIDGIRYAYEGDSSDDRVRITTKAKVGNYINER